MLRAAIWSSVLLVVACVAPAPGPAYPPSAYSSQPAYLSNESSSYEGSSYESSQYPSADPEGAQPGYPQGYRTGYPPGYPDGNAHAYGRPQYVQPQPAYPQAECKSAYGTTVCGYNCVAAYGDVKCASQPSGACQAAYGQVTCSEPTQAVYGGYGVQQQAECKSAYGETVCGYGCVAAYGVVRCASQPGGICQAAYGEVTCSN